MVPKSVSLIGDKIYLMMLKMGWKSGDTLGKNDKGLRIPVVVYGSDWRKYEGLGYNASNSREICELGHIVDVLKLKNEQIQVDCDRVLELNSVFEEENLGSIDKSNFRSEILVQVKGFEIIALVDTGSDITCISEEFWQELVKKHPNLPLMPIKSIQVKAAVGRKSVDIRNITLLPLKVGQVIIETGFLIVPGLSRSLIIGFDWLKDKRVKIILNGMDGILLEQNGNEHFIEFFGSREELKEVGKGDQCNQLQKGGVEILRDCKIGTTLEKDELTKLECLLEKFEGLFTSNLGRANCYEHVIKMEEDVPIVKKTYPVPYAFRDKVEGKIREMEEQNIIKRQSTPYCSPLTFTLKKDGSIRVLLDAREINLHMISETEKPPLQLDVLNSFHGAKFISIIDLNNAYFQIPISEDSKKYTGFTFNGKSYVYNVLPQGLKTSVGSFSRAMDVILGHEVREFCVNYLDDLAIITTGTLDQHLGHLDIVLGKLSAAGLTCNLNKCEFLCKEVRMLGYIISTEGLRTDPDKVEAIQKFPVPKKLKHVRAFLGLCNFYRRFIPEYSLLIQPLCNLLKKGKNWNWGEIEQQTFEQIKANFIKTVQLSHPDFTKPYLLQTDSSGLGLAGVLYQIDDVGEKRVLGFHSRVFKGAQKNWTVTEQEFYAIISCLEKFETYLRGSKVTIQTDHRALVFVKHWKLFNARVTRWINFLELFQYQIEHINGKANIGADILSRHFPESSLEDNWPQISYTEIKKNDKFIENFKDLIRLQREDPEIKLILEKLDNVQSSANNLDKLIGKCSKENGVLYFKPTEVKVIFLPSILREETIKQVHLEMGHQGSFKVIKYLRQRFFWKGLSRDVKGVLRKCHECQITRSNSVKFVGPCQSIITSEIGEIVMIDLYGPLPTGQYGNNYILVIQDSFSKFVKFYELRKATSQAVVGRVKKVL